MSGTRSGSDRRPVDSPSPTETAADLLVPLRTGEDPEPYLSTLADYDEAALEPVRTDRQTALAFWVNLYNAGTQLLLERRPDLYESPLRFLRFFRADAVTVGDKRLSLDEIEQGLLRGRRSKYGLGYLPRVPRRFERRYALDCDPRIHFACNCGAASCPAIRAYEPQAVDEQLDLAAETYLGGTVDYDAEADVAQVPRVFLWYRGDFGGNAGIRAVLRKYGTVPDDASPRLKYKPWNWEKAKGKFVE
jgi:hypothetical protein